MPPPSLQSSLTGAHPIKVEGEVYESLPCSYAAQPTSTYCRTSAVSPSLVLALSPALPQARQSYLERLEAAKKGRQDAVSQLCIPLPLEHHHDLSSGFSYSMFTSSPAPENAPGGNNRGLPHKISVVSGGSRKPKVKYGRERQERELKEEEWPGDSTLGPHSDDTL